MIKYLIYNGIEIKLYIYYKLLTIKTLRFMKKLLFATLCLLFLLSGNGCTETTKGSAPIEATFEVDSLSADSTVVDTIQ